jgi:hypothetical protein
MQPARARWSTEAVASGGVAILGVMTVAVGYFHVMVLLAAVIMIAGGAWIVFISLVNALMQALAPDWVRARVLAVFMLVFQGSVAAGSAVWGAVAGRVGIHVALVGAGAGIILSVMLGRFAKLPDTTIDPSPWNHWRMPVIPANAQPDLDDGPVLVTAEYTVAREHASEFLDAMYEYGRVRRRDGAYQWGIFRDIEKADRYIETFLVSSWAEHLRQHDRSTTADRGVEDRVFRHVIGDITVRHLVSARSHE